MKNKLSPKGKFDLVFFAGLLVAGIILAWNFNFRNRVGPSPFYADKANYYVYLPATFIYGWDVYKFPKGIDEKTRGFTLHYPDNRLIIKTTYGVALMVAPFFLVTHLIAVTGNLQPDGFSDIYEKMTIFPAVFYLVLGMFFLKKFLDRYFKGAIPYLAVFLVVAGTNLYYYGLRDSLMSHVYSFFLFSFFLFLLKKFFSGEKRSLSLFILISFVLALAVLIRPTNILLLAWAFLLDVRTGKELRDRILLLIKPGYIAIVLLSLFIVYLPQLFYWKYLSGSFFYYSYPGESFSNWRDPQLIPLWFAPLNGLFLYSPLVLLFVAGIIIMIVKKVPNGIFVGGFFLLISYLFASWHVWFFGGSCGSRPFTEFYSLLALPFAVFLDFTRNLRNRFVQAMAVLLIFFASWYSLRIVYCPWWNTFSIWSWDDYLKHLDAAGLYVWPGETYTYKNDFENPEKLKVYPQGNVVHSPTMAGMLDSVNTTTDTVFLQLGQIMKKPVRKVILSLWIDPGPDPVTGAVFSCNILNAKGEVQVPCTIAVDRYIQKPDAWNRVDTSFRIPEWVPDDDMISFFLRNNIHRKQAIYVDDIVMKFE